MLTNFYLIWLITTKLIYWSPFMIEGDSMVPTLHNKELFLIDKKSSSMQEIKRGEIVVFSFDKEFFYIKRVIGLPGEKLKLNSSGVWIKGSDDSYQKLDEYYLGDKKFHYGDERYFIVPENSYFVLGDNRDHSKDSRYFTPPYIGLSQIYGRYIFP